MSFDIKDVVSSAVSSAFNALASLLEEVTISSTSSSSYNPATGVVTKGSSMENISGVFTDIEESDPRYAEERQIEPDSAGISGKLFLVEKSKVSSTITTGSELMRISDSSKWSIISIKLDPTESVYEFLVRSAI